MCFFNWIRHDVLVHDGGIAGIGGCSGEAIILPESDGGENNRARVLLQVDEGHAMDQNKNVRSFQVQLLDLGAARKNHAIAGESIVRGEVVA